MFQEIVIVGTGKFAFSCAKISKKECKFVKVFEYIINKNISVLEGLCRKNEIEYYRVENDCLYNYLCKTKGKILVVSAFNTYIFDKRFFQLKNLLIINYHPALLPCHPGRNSEAWAIYEQDKVTGITWHLVQEKVDSGDILAQTEIILDDTYTSLTLMMKQNVKGIEKYEELCPLLLCGNVPRYKQENRIVKYHKSKDIPNEGYLDMSWSQEKKYAFLRAMDYGKLYIMGIPKMIMGSDIYIWDSYEYIDNVQSILLGENDYRISENIVLRNRRKYQDE